MATAIVDMDVNEGSTFVFTMDLWENDDGTIPVDLTEWSFEGSIDVSTKCIPLTITTIANGITVEADSSLMVDLPKSGKYDVEWTHMVSGEKFRLIQGNLRISQEVARCA